MRAGEPEQRLLAVQPQPDLAPLLRSDADDVLFPRTVQVELRQMFTLLGDRIAKHVGVDLAALRRRPAAIACARGTNPVAARRAGRRHRSRLRRDRRLRLEPPAVRDGRRADEPGVARDRPVDRAPRAATRSGSPRARRSSSRRRRSRSPRACRRMISASSSSRCCACSSPSSRSLALDADAIATQMQKLRRLIPTGLMNELKPFALAIDPQRFSHRDLARDLKIAGLRAGLVASGSLLAGLRILAAQTEVADVAELPGRSSCPGADLVRPWRRSRASSPGRRFHWRDLLDVRC